MNTFIDALGNATTIGALVHSSQHGDKVLVVKAYTKGWATLADADHPSKFEVKARPKSITPATLPEHAPVEQDDDELEQDGHKLAKTIAKYRHAYVPTLSASGKKSLSNGDSLAMYLSGREAEEVCHMADLLLGEVQGYHAAKYGLLNKGQQRMNAGNRIRAAVKRGAIDATWDDDGQIKTLFAVPEAE